MTSAFDVERAVELILVVDLDEDVEVDRRAPPRKGRAGRPGTARATIEQHRVRARGRGLVDLVGVDDEVLAQDRQGRSPRAPRAGPRASRRSVGLGEDRQGGRAPALVCADEVGHGDALADRARARRAPLVLGDDRHAGLDQRLGEGPLVAARGPRPARGRTAESRAGGAGPRRAYRATICCRTFRPATPGVWLPHSGRARPGRHPVSTPRRRPSRRGRCPSARPPAVDRGGPR